MAKTAEKRAGLGGRLYRGEKSFNFIGNRRRWYGISGVFIILSLFALTTQGLKLGIEFKGGASFTVTTTNLSLTDADARKAVASAGVTGDVRVLEIRAQKTATNKFQIETGALAVPAAVVKANIAQTFGANVDDIDAQIIGPSWGKEITRKALYGLFAFLFFVLIYLAMAFEPKMAFAAIVAVIHDVFITVGIYALVGFDVTPATVIGFLTILGYSLYDTVVVFDKVRENTRNVTSLGKQTYSQAANLAVNQTLVRSFNTSLIALLPVGSILFVGAGLLGAGTLKDLSLALFIGLATGTYSSIFIATPLLAALREREPAMQALARRVGSRPGSNSTALPSSPAKTLGSTAIVQSDNRPRGPRNQPKRKDRKRRP